MSRFSTGFLLWDAMHQPYAVLTVSIYMRVRRHHVSACCRRRRHVSLLSRFICFSTDKLCYTIASSLLTAVLQWSYINIAATIYIHSSRDTAKLPQAGHCQERQNPLGSRNRTEQYTQKFIHRIPVDNGHIFWSSAIDSTILLSFY